MQPDCVQKTALLLGGVLAPHARWRPLVVPQPPPEAVAVEKDSLACLMMSMPESSKPMKSRSKRWLMLGGRQQPALPVQAFLVVRVSPGPDVAGEAHRAAGSSFHLQFDMAPCANYCAAQWCRRNLPPETTSPEEDRMQWTRKTVSALFHSVALRVGWLVLVALAAVGCSGGGDETPKKVWKCDVLSTGTMEVCLCDDNGKPGAKSESCPSGFTCCSLTSPNDAGVTVCDCLPNALTCGTPGPTVTVVPSCPP